SLPEKPDEMQHAIAVLLVEAARMDDTFDAQERGVIARLLKEKFSLDHVQVDQLLAAAEETSKRASQIYPFTRLAVMRMTPEQRVKLIEMLGEGAYAEGVLDPEEDMLLRRIAGLIYVSDEDRVAARRRVLARRNAP